VNDGTTIEQNTDVDALFALQMRELAHENAPRLFAIVEEYGEQRDVRVAGYGLAHDDHADVNSVEGDFTLHSQSAEHARSLFEISSRSAGVRRTHVVWLDGTRVSVASAKPSARPARGPAGLG
jgi:hypothetical protein